MGIIGQIVAGRPASQRAYALLRQRALTSSSGPARVPACEHAFRYTTAAETLAGTSGNAELLSGLESWSGSSRGTADAGVGSGVVLTGHSVDQSVDPGDNRRADPLSVAGQGASGMMAAPGKMVAPGMMAAPLAQADEALRTLRETVIDEVRLLGFVEAADFAGRVEEISRSVEFLQIVAAQAVERSRNEAQQAGAGRTSPTGTAASQEWRTGWTDPVPGTDTASVSNMDGDSSTTGTGTGSAEGGPGSAANVLDDGYRDAAQFLRARLRIGISEARRRLALAPNVLPQAGMTGQEIPARRETLAQTVGTGLISSKSATIISTALDKVRHLTDQDTITRMEHSLTATATETDPDFLTTMTKRWIDSIDQNGPEPSEELLRQHQGAFLRKRRRYGLHHIEIFATDEQYETLTTAMNTATNPRLTTNDTNTDNDTGSGAGARSGAGAGGAAPGVGGEAGGVGAGGAAPGTGPDLDRRSRAQKLLNGLVGACSVAMTTGKLPSNGGYRPQLAITIGYQELLEQLTNHQQHSKGAGVGAAASTGAAAGAGFGTGTGLGTGTATFTGPIYPNTIRKIACDADIIPILLGSDSRVLDIGRTTRIFPPHIRKAIPHIDPHQTPRRNHHHTPQRT
ncbi:HNH endonuclease [Arthrobacter sp. 9V]|uniref:DUF222 domain-containing protein n=1 Tax=Arthrobacter sp. 9V TaxID=2653132 RepID=UPI0012F1639B|nr:DUF222 domain-containing protein [Arthrobacter sp. 9V]VXB36529.1 HNH endonuclease [Arthrobacter sp. 9V]